MNRLCLLPFALALACNPATSGDTGALVDSGSGDDGGTDDQGTTDSGDTTDDGGTDSGTGDDGTDSGEEPCEVELDETWPEDGDSDVYFRAELWAAFDDADETASFTVADSDGADVPGTYWWDDETLWFHADDGFTPASDFTATVTWCGGQEAFDFSTSELGTPLEEDTDLVGNVYLVDLSSATWVEPEGLESFIGDFDTSLLMEVVQADDVLVMTAGVTESGAADQDHCSPTTDFPDADFTTSPYYQVGPGDVPLGFGGVEVTLHEFLLSGTFTSDGSEIQEGVLKGELDVRDLGELFGDYGDADTICDYIIWVGAECGGCTSDGEEYCLPVHMTEVNSTLQDETDLDEVLEFECHPECEASYSNADCDTSGW